MRSASLTAVAEAITTRDENALVFRQLSGNPQPDRRNRLAASVLEPALAARLVLPPDAVVIDIADAQNGKLVTMLIPGPEGSPAREEPALLGHFEVAIRQPDGRWLHAEPRDDGLFDSRERRFLLLFLLSALAMLPSAWLFARRLADPIQQFADAAERLGRDPSATPPVIDSPAEIARAADAFGRMQQRLQAYVADRTRMLGAIAHDLRTPLTRLRFRIEQVDDGPEKAAMARDIAEMEAMVAATMNLASADSEAAPRQRLELGSLVESLADDMALVGRPVTADARDSLVVDGDPVALRRLFQNLLENGATYGRKAHATAWRDGANAIVDIEDDGPGIPQADLERVFEPFARLESSRSRETGGIGLGLAIVRSTARAHGGDVTLANRPQGGLTARVTLPLAQG